MASGRTIYYSDYAPKDLQVDWKSADIKMNEGQTEFLVRVPEIHAGNWGHLARNTVGVRKLNGATIGLTRINENKLSAEVLDATNGIVVVGMK
jgi:hypothetical protein